MTHPQHPPPCAPSPVPLFVPAAFTAWLPERESALRAARKFFFTVSPSSEGGATGLIERWTIVAVGEAEVGELPSAEVVGVETGKPIPIR